MRSSKKVRTFPRLYVWLAFSAVGGCIVMFGLGAAYFVVASTGWSRGEYEQTDSIECNGLAARYGIEVVTPKNKVSIWYAGGTIRAGRPNQDEVDLIASALAEEFSIYPLDTVQRSKLERIVLCKNLRLNSDSIAGVPDFRRNLLFLDVSYFASNPAYTRQTMHHEFFHIIDCQDDGKIQSDPEWQALNTPGFQYGNGGWSATRDPESGVPTEKYPGFLNHYSTTGVEEDKAEIFSYMIVDPEYVKARALKDPVIRAKAARMKVLLKKFSPSMDEAFWDRVESMNRQEQ